MRKPLIAGNWKMFLNRESGAQLAKILADRTGDITDRDILICPAAPLLSEVSKVIVKSKIVLGAQNMYFEREGAYTGEISADMLISVGCSYVILGHSERRHVFDEENSSINKKVRFALQEGLKPILCVGELLEEREAGRTEKVLWEQMVKGLKDVSLDNIGKVTIAYEPVWAIGTGKTATPEDADANQSFIRSTLVEMYSGNVGENMRILYGGSVKPDNIDGLMAKENVDGALVGGASLKADSFFDIITFKEH
jgi:triosephosphate isomerase